ncbi:MAG TPA: hypothetical protein VHQ46_01185 [Desulfobacteria bacterium]|nr:hypothetical protein [Desulfobacteria bacterium]
MAKLDSKIGENPLSAPLYLQAAEILDTLGFFQKAYTYLAKAEALDPNGAVLAEFSRRRYYHHEHEGGCSLCDFLCGMCVLDSCCECMGGDLIECC